MNIISTGSEITATKRVKVKITENTRLGKNKK